jgi:hypothetical protein
MVINNKLLLNFTDVELLDLSIIECHCLILIRKEADRKWTSLSDLLWIENQDYKYQLHCIFGVGSRLLQLHNCITI